MTTGQQFTDVMGIDFTLDDGTPPLTQPPLSLLLEARTLIDLTGMINRRQQLVEQAASAAEQLPDDIENLVNNQADSLQDTDLDLYQLMSEWNNELASLESQLARVQGWEHGFQYLPELGLGAVTVFTEDTDPAITNAILTALKQVGPNQNLFGWNDPFLAVGLDSRSLFGLPNTDMAKRVQRATRALIGHEAYQCEFEFWTGSAVPTNFHLSASPNSVQTSPHRTLVFPFDNPTPTPGTVLGVAESLSDSLASLDQAIARADAGTGMIHATPYVVQKWMQVYPFIRDNQGNIRTVNNNILVPGYGYPGTGPDQESRTVNDGVTTDGSADITSATAAFTTFDIGMPVEGDGVPPGTTILEVTSATDATMSQPATADGTAIVFTFPGVGGDAGGSIMQWAYATDFVFHLQGDIMTYPLGFREMSPDVPVQNLAEARAERSHSFITNNLLRAAVLVDTGTL